MYFYTVCGIIWTCLFPSHPVHAWSVYNRTPPHIEGAPLDLLGESHDVFFKPRSARSSSKAWFRPLFKPFRLLGVDFIVSTTFIGRFHYLDCSYWLNRLYTFCVWLNPVLYEVHMPGWLFTTPCCAFRLGRLRPILVYWYLKDVCICFLNFYSFDPAPLIIVFTEAFIEEFTSGFSLISVLPQLFFKNLP